MKNLKNHGGKKKMAKKQKSGNKPYAKFGAGNMEVVVWKRISSRNGKPFCTFSLTKQWPDYQTQSLTWRSLHGLSAPDLCALSSLIQSALQAASPVSKQALEQSLAAGGEE
jgi:hypothetical protein